MTEVIDVPQGPKGTVDLPPLLRSSDQWTDSMVTDAGIPLQDKPFVTVGGGIGSFVMADYLRIAGGLPTSDIQVVSNLSHPWQTYEHLATASQIALDNRIRSDAASRPDNIWGFPSYAVSEAIRKRTIKPLMQVLVEPVFADFYTPRLRAVLESIDREARRIRYWDMLERGDVELVRRRVGGGYFVVHADRRAAEPVFRAVRCRDVHLAVGYTGLQFLPELQEFRERMNDFHHVVNAYEDHEHVYQALRLKPRTVLVRGGGIVASRVVERLIRERVERGTRTQIVHVLRTYVAGKHGKHAWARRRGQDGFAYQGFNYPKSVWGGQLKAEMRRLDADARSEVYREIGGTTTAWRREWQRQMRLARSQGWYRVLNGTFEDLKPDGDGLEARLRVADGGLSIRADFVIDCTGLNADVTEHQVLGDLLQRGGARMNGLGRLDVDRAFAVRGADSGMGKLYATGAATLGGPFPGVDTFLGLQIAAQEVVDDVARRGHCRRMGPMSSFAGWLRWATGREI
ncbi:FAD/NAD(P)-binding protein [Amycolatopsis keratiniphila]|uniref:hypothetical protein n=1 Tax=Amycolatopsis keratiniphila TaxID=129921 RepID=UPI00087A85F6|nr:hypothetical protein [Amycolatopsis keratiniphila]SDU35667.1 hypothetical protein SAMN04489733_3360 [Amycolatopsis keratiniphila]